MASLQKEELIQMAVAAVKAAAACALGIPEQFQTVWRRLTGKTQSRRAAHMTVQLNAQQERTIAPKVTALCGRKPSRRWVYRFLRRHPDCVLGRPAGLDSKRARAFNFTTVQKHFELLQEVLDKNGSPIPDCNVSNFDEIGIQIGGGHKGTGEQYFYAQGDRSKYKIKSDDLELVAVIETIAADGAALVPPCFVFSGVNMCPEWFAEGHADDPKWKGNLLCVIRSLTTSKFLS
ncbi:hypothetical protein B0H17DRAFT_1126529 [Mycena rosella]|uniref:HTH CENPB-type domain-containing protein n=1 Tax=Mycena rosella TaxID=1033263 RepID=A0AAD7M7R5_MYCRO|nr:hypothetical protein B0H17DRAFT_1126529 [Mycena rosella]